MNSIHRINHRNLRYSKLVELLTENDVLPVSSRNITIELSAGQSHVGVLRDLPAPLDGGVNFGLDHDLLLQAGEVIHSLLGQDHALAQLHLGVVQIVLDIQGLGDHFDLGDGLVDEEAAHGHLTGLPVQLQFEVDVGIKVTRPGVRSSLVKIVILSLVFRVQWSLLAASHALP